MGQMLQSPEDGCVETVWHVVEDGNRSWWTFPTEQAARECATKLAGRSGEREPRVYGGTRVYDAALDAWATTRPDFETGFAGT